MYQETGIDWNLLILILGFLLGSGVIIYIIDKLVKAGKLLQWKENMEKWKDKMEEKFEKTSEDINKIKIDIRELKASFRLWLDIRKTENVNGGPIQRKSPLTLTNEAFNVIQKTSLAKEIDKNYYDILIDVIKKMKSLGYERISEEERFVEVAPLVIHSFIERGKISKEKIAKSFEELKKIYKPYNLTYYTILLLISAYISQKMRKKKFSIEGSIFQSQVSIMSSEDISEILSVYDWNTKKAIKELKKLYESQKKIEELDSARTLVKLADLFGMTGEWSKALNNYERALKVFDKEMSKKDISSSLRKIGNIHQDQGKYKKAIEKYNQSLEIEEELGNKSGIAKTLHNLGNIHHAQGEYEKAIEKYDQSLEIKEELGDKRGIAITLHQLGMIHQDQGEYEKAIEKYDQSLEIKEELGDKSGIAGTLNQMGLISIKDKNYEKALREFLISFSIFDKLKSPNKDIVGGNIARLRIELGEEKFEKLYGKVIAELEKS